MQKFFSVGAKTGTTVTLNIAKGGVEIRFGAKPTQTQLEAYKSSHLKGWKWSRFSRCWYAKLNDRTLAVANDLAGTDLKLPNFDKIEREGWLMESMEEMGNKEYNEDAEEQEAWQREVN